jgi:hypothetical protein
MRGIISSLLRKKRSYELDRMIDALVSCKYSHLELSCLACRLMEMYQWGLLSISKSSYSLSKV